MEEKVKGILISINGLSYDAVMKLVEGFAFQGYELYLKQALAILADLLELEFSQNVNERAFHQML